MSKKKHPLIDSNSHQPVIPWHENVTDLQLLLNLINTEGFILEDAVDEILSTYSHDLTIHRGEVFEKAPHRENIRPEIDLWAQSGNFVFLIESKKSAFNWIFLQNQDTPKDVHLITGPEKTISVHNRLLNCVDCISKQAVEVLPEENKTSLRKQEKNNKTTNLALPIRSTREDLVRSAIRQALFNTEILIHNQLNDNSWKGQSHRIFIPIIVTNTPLFSCIYNPAADINSQADLTKITLKKITTVAFNHSEILRWGPHYERTLEHIGQPAWGTRLTDDTRFKKSHNKTVFVVSKENLLSFINQIKDLK